jgi:hypothetical protein
VARCSCTTIRRVCSSRRAPTTTSPRACTTTASGFGIIDNRATQLYVVVEVPKTESAKEVDPEAVARDLGPGGPIAREHLRYEDRARSA